MATAPIPTLSLQDHAYEHVREQICSGAYLPGMRLDYRVVGQEIGVSTTPVREAMRRLENEGLVELVPRLGAVVKKLDREEMRELYGVREAIESYAASKSDTISQMQLDRMGEYVAEMDRLIAAWTGEHTTPMVGDTLHRFLELDWKFHQMIIEAAGNRRLLRIVETCHVMTRIFYADRADHHAKRLKQANEHHHQILDLLRQHDGEGARRKVIEHVRGSLEWSMMAG